MNFYFFSLPSVTIYFCFLHLLWKNPCHFFFPIHASIHTNLNTPSNNYISFNFCSNEMKNFSFRWMSILVDRFFKISRGSRFFFFFFIPLTVELRVESSEKYSSTGVGTSCVRVSISNNLRSSPVFLSFFLPCRNLRTRQILHTQNHLFVL